MPHLQSYLYCLHPGGLEDSRKVLSVNSQLLGTLLPGEILLLGLPSQLLHPPTGQFLEFHCCCLLSILSSLTCPADGVPPLHQLRSSQLAFNMSRSRPPRLPAPGFPWCAHCYGKRGFKMNRPELETAWLAAPMQAQGPEFGSPASALKKPDMVIGARNLSVLRGRAETVGSLGVTGQSLCTLCERLSQE